MARSLRERLQGLQRQVMKSPPLEETSQNDGIGLDFGSTQGQEISQTERTLSSLGFSRRQGNLVDYFVREIRNDVLTLHGHIPFQAIFETDLSGLFALVGQPFHISDLRFYDTETTGLGTGAGTFAFLHTIGRFFDDEFCLYQYFVDDYSAEESILGAIEKDHFSPSTILVTFNGKSFDWPMLQGRRAMYRMEKQEIKGHIDLLHPARRFWKKALGSVSLVSVEAQVLGFVREDDLPGKEAPARYFEYVNTGNPLVIEPVLEHNAMDVSSLVGIVTSVADLLTGRMQPENAETYTALAKYYTEWHDFGMAEKYYKAATASMDATWSTHWRRSLFLKRMGLIEDAKLVWLEMVDLYPDSVAPIVELAKLAEHKDKNYPIAKHWVELAMERYRNNVLAAKNLILEGRYVWDERLGPSPGPGGERDAGRHHGTDEHQGTVIHQSSGNSVGIPYRVKQTGEPTNQVNSRVDDVDLLEDRIFAELAHRFNRIVRKEAVRK